MARRNDLIPEIQGNSKCLGKSHPHHLALVFICQDRGTASSGLWFLVRGGVLHSVAGVLFIIFPSGVSVVSVKSSLSLLFVYLPAVQVSGNIVF